MCGVGVASMYIVMVVRSMEREICGMVEMNFHAAELVHHTCVFSRY